LISIGDAETLVDLQVMAFDPTQLGQRFSQRSPDGLRSRTPFVISVQPTNQSDARSFLLLRARRERPHHRAADRANEFPPLDVHCPTHKPMMPEQ